VVELNRAVAVGMAEGPAAGLALVERLLDEPVLADYHLLPTVRADFLGKLGRLEEAREDLLRAARMARSPRERELLLSRAESCENGVWPPPR
jgi:predicted RNA polymerase sigma factor